MIDTQTILLVICFFTVILILALLHILSFNMQSKDSGSTRNSTSQKCGPSPAQE